MRYKKAFLLLPLLIFYVSVSLIVAEDNLEGADQIRYVRYAENLTSGYYAPKDTLMLWNGPGYPILLTPFVWARIPWLYAKYLNPFLLFAGICLVYFLLCEYLSPKISLACAFVLGLYPPFLFQMPLIMSESLSVFLVCAFAFFVVRYCRSSRRSLLVAAVIFGGYLILTRVMFAYVVTTALFLSLLLCIFKSSFRRMVYVYLLCLLVCTPYLVYTWSITGKFFYWASSGGTTLYWMSNPYSNEYGDWRSSFEVKNYDRYGRHRPFYEKLEGLNFVEQGRLCKQQAIQNVRRYPHKCFVNWLSNLGRIWFDYPYTYKYQRPHTLLYMLPNAFLLITFILCLYPLLRKAKQLPVELVSLGCFACIYMAGSSLVSAVSRFLVPVVPVLAVVVFYTAFKLLDIRFSEKALT